MAVIEAQPQTVDLEIAKMRLCGALGYISVEGYEALMPDFVNAFHRQYTDSAEYLATYDDVATALQSELDDLRYDRGSHQPNRRGLQYIHGRLLENGAASDMPAAITLTLFDLVDELRPAGH